MYGGVLIVHLNEIKGKGNALQLYRQTSARARRVLGRSPAAHEEVCVALLVHVTHPLDLLS